MCMSPMSLSAIPAYYFFSVGDSVHVAVEVTSGKFQFMSFGCLLKDGVYTGGQYFSGTFCSYWPHYAYASDNYVPNYFSAMRAGRLKGGVYIDADSTASWRIAEGSSTPEIWWPCVTAHRSGNNIYSQSGLASFFWSHSPNFYNNIAAMCPIYTLVKRDDDNYSSLGIPEGVRFMNVTNYTPGQELTYGDETWKVFHADSLSDDPVNMYCGMAFKKVM